MHENEFLLYQVALERVHEARADAARRAVLARRRDERRTERESAFAIWAKIVENARSGLMNVYRRVLLEG
jgi:hypothetical protein